MHHAISLYVILGQYLATQNAIQQGLVSGTVIKSIEHQSDASDMIAIRIRSPDISIHAENVLLCMSTPVPDENGTLALVRLAPTLALNKKYYLAIEVCDGPGVVPPQGESPMWDCGASSNFVSREPSLRRGHVCHDDRTGVIVLQFNGGPNEDSILDFRHADAGILVGAGTPHRHFVLILHVPHQTGLVNGRTGMSGFDFLLSRPPLPKPVSILYMLALGFLAPKSLDSVTGTFVLGDNSSAIHLKALHTHAHGMAVEMRGVIEKRDGSQQIILLENPRIFVGVRHVDITVQPGDRLSVRCTFNNTADHLFHVQHKEMCVSDFFYTTDGASRGELNQLFSIDPYYAGCLRASGANESWITEYGISSFHARHQDLNCVTPPFR